MYTAKEEAQGKKVLLMISLVLVLLVLVMIIGFSYLG